MLYICTETTGRQYSLFNVCVGRATSWYGPYLLSICCKKDYAIPHSEGRTYNTKLVAPKSVNGKIRADWCAQRTK